MKLHSTKNTHSLACAGVALLLMTSTAAWAGGAGGIDVGGGQNGGIIGGSESNPPVVIPNSALPAGPTGEFIPGCKGDCGGGDRPFVVNGPVNAVPKFPFPIKPGDNGGGSGPDVPPVVLDVGPPDGGTIPPAPGGGANLGELSPAAGGNTKLTFVDCINANVLSKLDDRTSEGYETCRQMTSNDTN